MADGFPEDRFLRETQELGGFDASCPSELENAAQKPHSRFVEAARTFACGLENKETVGRKGTLVLNTEH